MKLKAERPARTYVTGAVTTWVRRVAVAITFVTVAVVLVRYPSLPKTIPIHYNLAGEVDDWGPRSSVSILAAISIALVCGLAWLSHYPHILNYPREITPENAQTVYRAGERLIVWTTAACSVLLIGILALVTFSDTAWVAG